MLFGFSCKPFLPRILALIFLLSIMSKSIWRKGLVSWLTVNAAFPSSVRKGGETFHSLLVTFYSLLVTCYSLLIAFYSLLVTHWLLLATLCFLFITHCFVLVTRFTRYSLLCTPCYILVILCNLLGTHYVLFIQYIQLYSQCSH